MARHPRASAPQPSNPPIPAKWFHPRCLVPWGRGRAIAKKAGHPTTRPIRTPGTPARVSRPTRPRSMHTVPPQLPEPSEPPDPTDSAARPAAPAHPTRPNRPTQAPSPTGGLRRAGNGRAGKAGGSGSRAGGGWRVGGVAHEESDGRGSGGSESRQGPGLRYLNVHPRPGWPRPEKHGYWYGRKNGGCCPNSGVQKKNYRVGALQAEFLRTVFLASGQTTPLTQEQG